MINTAADTFRLPDIFEISKESRNMELEVLLATAIMISLATDLAMPLKKRLYQCFHMQGFYSSVPIF